MSRICDKKCSKHKIVLVFLSKLLCFSFISVVYTVLNVSGG